MKKKSKEFRVCTDFSTGLNATFKDDHYPLPSPEEIFAKLNAGKCFSRIDLNDAYLQIPVEECSKLLSINTYLELYKLGRLLSGVKVAPAIFQHVTDTRLSDLDFAVAYLDDILMNSPNVEQHKEHAYKEFSRIYEYDFKLKESKSKFFMEKFKYLGLNIDTNARKPDPGRAIAIKDMPAPENVSALQSFLELANFYQVFMPNIHNLRGPLKGTSEKREVLGVDA